MYSIYVNDGINAQIVYSSLEDYLEKLQRDKRTRYNGAPNFGQEDLVFLNDAITRTRYMMEELSVRDRNIVKKVTQS